MNKRNNKSEHKKEIAEAVVNMINEGAEHVTTLSDSPEAKYESIDEKVPGKD